LEWLVEDGPVIAFRRGDVSCLVNFGPSPAELPTGGELLLASGPLDGTLPPDTCVWWRGSADPERLDQG
jgi:alpha-glucosidase